MSAETTRIPTTPSSRIPGNPCPELTEPLIAAGCRATAWAVDVVEGRVVQGPHVRNACLRHLWDLVRGPERGLWYDLAKAQHIWTWWEGVLKLSGGQFEGKPFLLHPSQAFRLGMIFGWQRRHEDGGAVRRFRRFYDEEGKGNGKSPLAGGVGLYLMTADGEAGAEIYACGAKKEQAKILFADAVKMARKAPALYPKRLKFSGGEGNEYNILYRKGGMSFFRPISKESGKKGSGPRPHGALADEVHEHPNRDAVDMLERGFKSRRQPLLAMFTNSGSDRNSFCWEERTFAVKVAAGTRTPDEEFAFVGEWWEGSDDTFAFVCALDKGDDPLTDPSCWGKPNPLLGTILAYEELARAVAQAREIPGKRNGILRLHFCIWTDADVGWLPREAIEAVLADFDPAIHHGKDVSSGLDLSKVSDLTAAAHVVETGVMLVERDDGSTVELPTYDAWIEAWTPKEGLRERAQRDSAPYDVWVDQGHLRTTPGPLVRYDIVAAHFAALSLVFLLRVLAYDQYAYAAFKSALDEQGVEVLQVWHPQGGTRRAQPSEEQKAWAKDGGDDKPLGLWMPGSLEALETVILEGRIRLRISPVLISAIMSAAIEEDAQGNRWFSKRKATQRIDPLVALAMAFGAAVAKGLERRKSVYESRGLRR